MPSTIEALAAVAAALLPGAVFTYAFEHTVGSWGVTFQDRLYRFLAWSAAIHVTLAPLTYVLWRAYRDRLIGGGPELLVLWAAAILYLAAPILAGRKLGSAFRDGSAWARMIVGSPAPSAWDDLWSRKGLNAWVRVRLKNGRWVAGAYSKGSYAAGHPNPPDLYLAHAVQVDADTGRWVTDDDGQPASRGSGLLIRWNDADLIEIVDG